jgi:hypothetical protein
VTVVLAGGTAGEAAAPGFAVRAAAGVAAGVAGDDTPGFALGTALGAGPAAAAVADEGSGVQTVESFAGGEPHPARSSAVQTHSAALRSFVRTERAKVTTMISSAKKGATRDQIRRT